MSKHCLYCGANLSALGFENIEDRLVVTNLWPRGIFVRSVSKNNFLGIIDRAIAGILVVVLFMPLYLLNKFSVKTGLAIFYAQK